MAEIVWTSDLKQWLAERSATLGFALSGVAAAEGLGDPTEAQDASRFQAWIDAGRAGEMEYLKRRDASGRLLRSSVKLSYPWANSVVVLAKSYRSAGPLSIEEAEAHKGWIARYAWSGQAPVEPHGDSVPALRPADYHDFLLADLQQLAQELGERTGAASMCYVDTGPIVERSLAARAGIGWIGKNTCVLTQEQGSWLLLAVIVTSLRLPKQIATLPSSDRCGSCTRCIDACPTSALVAPHEMDASRCIAYLTIEKKGTIPPELRPHIGRQVFGCDICQDVCPWNQHTSAQPVPTHPPVRQELINPELDWLAGMDAPTFKLWFKSSPIERTRRSRLHRNVAIAMGNSGETQFLARLNAWSTGDDPVLAEAATWAIERIQALRATAGPSAATTEQASLPLLC